MDGGGYADAIHVADADELLDGDIGAMIAQSTVEAWCADEHGVGKPVAETFRGRWFELRVGMVAAGLLF